MKQTEEELCEALCAEYDAFLNRTGLPAYSADELWHELADRIERAERDVQTLREHIDWVWRFCERWDAMSARAN
jgi:hypothetical protein